MASDLAWSLIPQANQLGHSGLLRQIFWAKYVFWVVLFPTVIIALGVLSGISWATILFNVFLSWVWIIAYLVAAYTPSNYKWGFFAFGTLAWLFLALSTLRHGAKSADRVGIKKDYFSLAAWTNFLWMMYPLAWGLSDGGNRIGVVPSFIWFGILDVLLLTGLGFAIVFMSRRWDYGRLNIAFTQYGRVPASTGTFPEKAPAPASAPAAAPPATVAV